MRKFAILTAMVLGAALLMSGCTGGDGGAAPSPTPESTPAPTPAPTPEPTPTPEPEIPRLDLTAMPAPADLTPNKKLPDIFTTFAGEKVETEWAYKARMQELRDLYQYYMCGFWPDRSQETVTYAFDGEALTVSVERDGQKTSFDAYVVTPDPAAVPMPQGGYPVLIFLGFGGPYNLSRYMADNGYAVITYNVPQIAADDSSRTGAFYDLYPYTGDIYTQTGTLLAWAWGASKVIDALEAGLDQETNISTENILLSGVSRYGKSAMFGGAFEERVKVTIPACSGSGGAGLFRYDPKSNVYDYSSVGQSAQWVAQHSEPLSSLQNSGERHWFNDMFVKFKFPNLSSEEPTEFESHDYLPFDQHCLAALCGTDGRYLFITGELDVDWTNPAGMYATFKAAQKAFDFTGTPDNIANYLHRSGHALLQEDLEQIIPYCNYHLYGIEPSLDLSALKTSIYETVESNRYDAFYDLVGR